MYISKIFIVDDEDYMRMISSIRDDCIIYKHVSKNRYYVIHEGVLAFEKLKHETKDYESRFIKHWELYTAHSFPRNLDPLRDEDPPRGTTIE